MMQTSGTGQAPSIRSDTEDDATDEDVDAALGFLDNF